MKQVLQKIGILFVIFIAAVFGYFYWVQSRTRREATVYTSMEESELPVVYMKSLGREMNCLHGYVQDMAGAVLRDSLTILPEEREMGIRIDRCQGQVTGIYYEIRSLDLSRLIERTSVESWNPLENGAEAVLPIQNLLNRDQEYLLSLTVDTDTHGAVRYYTRIMWTNNEIAKEMVDLAADFSAKTFYYEQATELTMYLESNNTGDNTNLGQVDIHSSFSQITWGGLKMVPLGEVFVSLRELSGSMSQVTVNYLTSREDKKENLELYEVEDNFVMRRGEQRIYMMDFERKTDQIFTGQPDLFSGNRILLGITDENKIHGKVSENKKIHAFVSNGDLWYFNEDDDDHRAVRIFSFRSSSEEGIRPVFREHSIKTLGVNDEGAVDFLVYGYMNRGHHEGCVGIAVYHYDAEKNALEERFFVPSSRSYEELQLDMKTLSYLSPGGMLYLKVDAGIYAIDLISNEYMVVAEGLPEGGYAVSQDGKRLAWQEGSQLYQSTQIHLMNLETGEKNEVVSAFGDCLRTLGFVGNDFIYGLAKSDSRWIINGRLEELPMYALEILGEDMALQTRYEKPGYFISGVSVEDSRIHLNRIVPVAGDFYQVVDEDTIVCNEEIPGDKLDGIGWYSDGERQKLYFIRLSSEIGRGKNISAFAPEKITYGMAEILNLGSMVNVPGMRFYAYGGGHLLGITRDFTEAVELAYEKMGIVVNESQQVLWSRVDRPTASTVRNQSEAAARLMKNIESFAESRVFSDGIVLLEARGCSLNQVLYFLGRGYPVFVYVEEGRGRLLMGYDSYNVTIYSPETGESEKMGLNDARDYFASYGNDFICGIFPQ